MKRNSMFEARREQIQEEVRESVSFSFEIVDRIHELLDAKDMKQRDLAISLGKSEAEISKWMRGTHNFTISTIKSIEGVLGEPIIIIASGKKKPLKLRSIGYALLDGTAESTASSRARKRSDKAKIE